MLATRSVTGLALDTIERPRAHDAWLIRKLIPRGSVSGGMARGACAIIGYLRSRVPIAELLGLAIELILATDAAVRTLGDEEPVLPDIASLPLESSDDQENVIPGDIGRLGNASGAGLSRRPQLVGMTCCGPRIENILMAQSASVRANILGPLGQRRRFSQRPGDEESHQAKAECEDRECCPLGPYVLSLTMTDRLYKHPPFWQLRLIFGTLHYRNYCAK